MIIYETYCKIKDLHEREGLRIAQIARALGLHPATVATWLQRPHYQPRKSAPRASLLDPIRDTSCGGWIRILTAPHKSSTACRRPAFAGATPS